MPLTVTARPGDSIDSLAYAHGHFPGTVWEAPENAALRALRADPNVLLPGDRVAIPDLRPKAVSAATGRSHRFRRRGVPSKFRLQLRDGGAPRAGLAYRLELDGAPHEGVTDDNGFLEHWAPPTLRVARLTLPGGEEYEILVGHLDPPEAATGVDGRLRSLGYLSADADAAEPTLEERRAALLAFQDAEGLPPTGEADPETCAALARCHGC